MVFDVVKDVGVIGRDGQMMALLYHFSLGDMEGDSEAIQFLRCRWRWGMYVENDVVDDIVDD